MRPNTSKTAAAVALILLVAPAAAAVDAPGATPLAKLVEEAEANNPDIRAARHAWAARAQVPRQASTLPDPEFVVQQFSVGSPRPFAGFSNSDFAYLGVGVSQELPFPGKLRLRGEVAQREAASAREKAEMVRRDVLEQLKTAYFRLAFVERALMILDRNQKLLEQIERIAEARYRVGQGNQQDVLKAQLQRTRLLREAALDDQERRTVEARLKQILNRPQDSADVMTEGLTETPLAIPSDELLARVREGNPEIAAEGQRVQQRGLEIELARKDSYPDFNLQYMWQHTAEQFRDYYMLSFGIRLPLHRSRRQAAEVAQASEELASARRNYEARLQESTFATRDQLLAAETSAHLLKIYREGLIPQAAATFEAGLAAYQANRQDFETLISSFLDVLNLDLEYWRALADHETALARLERLTGASLR